MNESARIHSLLRQLRHLVMIAVAATLCAGCSRFDTNYGASKGAAGNKSLNGFGAFRTVLQSLPEDAVDDAPPAEIRARDMLRLSYRELNNDAIVWIPSEWSPMNLPDIETWLTRWLEQGGRTLVFIVPDDGSTESYFREAIDIAPPAQRLEYRRRLAKQINDRLLSDSRRKDLSVKNWFVAKALPNRVHLPPRRLVDYEIKLASSTPSSSTKSADSNEPSDSDEAIAGEVSEEQWSEFDLEESPPMITSEINTRKPGLDPLIRETAKIAGRQTSLTTLARFVDYRWPDSQILIVASGSLLTNFAMTESPAQEMAIRIREEIWQASDVGDDERIAVAFFSTDDMPVSISESQPGAPNTKGWELMTQMPLSLINMHVAFLGVVLCLMLLPIFGRPRRVRHSRPTHFGNHLSAMATLMRRSGGVDYAHMKISQYLRHVRGETSGPWVLPEDTKEHKT
jgi:hypothetical protein